LSEDASQTRSMLVSLMAEVRKLAGTEGALVSGAAELELDLELELDDELELGCGSTLDTAEDTELDWELLILPLLLRELDERLLLEMRDELLDLMLLTLDELLEEELGGLSSQSFPGGAVLILMLALSDDQLPLASPACTR
jgi:hypothetical protein